MTNKNNNKLHVTLDNEIIKKIIHTFLHLHIGSQQISKI
jgi:hypothetical protein